MRALGDDTPNKYGFDTPEIYSPKCQQELELGRAAKSRMQELISQPGVKVKDSGVRDRYQRPLVWVILPSGRTAGTVLVSEGHARIWMPGYRGNWCN
ncbi:thermonuclease family protein [Labrenzia sp. DG1229]|uniref:thermonuclease family protein n=1 Tax=Labrenzia sp. DG1229 TaxID=681847 RepID=UPI0009FD2850|nr:thermonuclease family protein [Labrenzia sp. DG1229]